LEDRKTVRSEELGVRSEEKTKEGKKIDNGQLTIDNYNKKQFKAVGVVRERPCIYSGVIVGSPFSRGQARPDNPVFN